MQVWNVLHAARWKYRTQKKSPKKSPSEHHCTTLSGYIFATKARINNRKKNSLSSNMSSRCPHNVLNFSSLAAEIGLRVWGTPANSNGFRVLAALLHGSQLVGVSQTLRRWTEGTTYVQQGGHRIGHFADILVFLHLRGAIFAVNSCLVMETLRASSIITLTVNIICACGHSDVIDSGTLWVCVCMLTCHLHY